LGQISHLWFGPLCGKFPPKNPKFFNLFALGQKISSGRVKKYPGQRLVAASYLLRVKSMLGSGQGSSLLKTKVLVDESILSLFN